MSFENRYGMRNYSSSRGNLDLSDLIEASESISIEQTRKYLRNVGLRPTRQRIDIFGLLFNNGHRHLTATDLYRESCENKFSVSQATIYNLLKEFTQKGLLREIAVNGNNIHFDTNTSNHCHFYHENTGKLYDIDDSDIYVLGIPEAPADQEVWRIDVIVRIQDV